MNIPNINEKEIKINDKNDLELNINVEGDLENISNVHEIKIQHLSKESSS